MNTHADKTTETKSTAVANGMGVQQGVEHKIFQFEDNRPEAIAQRKIQEAANNSPQIKQLKAIKEMANNSLQANQLRAMQTMTEDNTTQLNEINERETIQNKLDPIQKKENKTDLPDFIKSRRENISGYSMTELKVHYNSDKPAQLNTPSVVKSHNGKISKAAKPNQNIAQRKYGYEFETMAPAVLANKDYIKTADHHKQLDEPIVGKWDVVADGDKIEIRTIGGLTKTELHTASDEIEEYLKSLAEKDLEKNWQLKGKPQMTVGIRPDKITEFIKWITTNKLGEMYDGEKEAANEMPAEATVEQQKVLNIEKSKKGLFEGPEVSKSKSLLESVKPDYSKKISDDENLQKAQQALNGLISIIVHYSKILADHAKSEDPEKVGYTLKSMLGPLISRSDLNAWYMGIRKLVPENSLDEWDKKLAETPKKLSAYITNQRDSLQIKNSTNSDTYLGYSPAERVAQEKDDDENLSLLAWLNYVFTPIVNEGVAKKNEEKINKVLPPNSAGETDKLSLGALPLDNDSDQNLVILEIRGLRNVVIPHKIWKLKMIELANEIHNQGFGDPQ